MFYSCVALPSIELPCSVTTIGGNAFSNCIALTSIEFPSSVTTIQMGAFLFCTSLTSIELPNNLTTIDNVTFAFCSALTSITIPAGVTTIGDHAFLECTALALITNLNPIPVNISASVFQGVSKNTCMLRVPLYSLDAYKNSQEWKNFLIEGIIGVETIETPILSIYPNPTKGELRIDGGELSVKNIEIFDVHGKKLSSYPYFASHSKIDISHLSSGVYFVKISTETGEVVKKVVKE